MSDTVPTTTIAGSAAAFRTPKPTLSFYYSESFDKAMDPKMSKSFFKGNRFTQCCQIGTQPRAAADTISLGDGTRDDITTDRA